MPPTRTADSSKPAQVAARAHPDGRPSGTSSRYGRAALDRQTTALAALDPGSRGIEAYAAGLRCGSLIAGGELTRALAEPALIAAAVTAGLSEREAAGHIERGIEQGLNSPHVRPPRRDHRRRELDERGEGWWQVAVATLAAPGWVSRRSAATTMAILAGLYALAEQAGTGALVASYRQLAEASGVTIGTISKHVKAGRLTPFVAIYTPKGARQTGASTRWSLRLHTPEVDAHLAAELDAVWNGNTPRSGGQGLRAPGVSVPLPGVAGTPFVDPRDDRWGPHGRSGWAVLLALRGSERSLSAHEVAEQVPVSEPTVRRWFGRLEQLGAIKTNGKVAYAIRSDEPVKLERATLMRARHRLDRDAYVRYLETQDRRPCWLNLTEAAA